MGKIIFASLLASILWGVNCRAQTVNTAYPHIQDQAPQYRFDNTLNYSNSIQLYDVKDRELAVIMNSARLKSENATVEEISQAGILISGSSDQSAREKYKNKWVEKLVNERNLALIKKMNSVPIKPVTEAGTVSALTAEQIKQTAASIELSPATDGRESLNNKYNPNRDMGYCFLRAHYYAGAVHQRGLDMGSVRKIFLIGTMKIFGANWAPIKGWRYHVATTVRGVDGKWYVLDNHLGFFQGKNGYSSRVYTVEEWYRYYEKFMNTTEELSANLTEDGNKESAHAKALFLYFADADRVIPEGIPYTKATYYGIDKNNNGQLDQNEVSFHGAFIDVDRFLSIPIPACSKERYAPLNPSDDRCRNLSAADQQQFRERELLLIKSRLQISYEEDQRMFPNQN